MKVAAAGGAEGRIGWITAFGRSDLGREILRRMPARIRRRVWASRRWQRRVAAQLRSRWHRSNKKEKRKEYLNKKKIINIKKIEKKKE